jgi:hypothetical protein
MLGLLVGQGGALLSGNRGVTPLFYHLKRGADKGIHRSYQDNCIMSEVLEVQQYHKIDYHFLDDCQYIVYTGAKRRY